MRPSWLLCRLLSATILWTLSCARRLPDIYWNSTNSIFDISNTDHVIPVRILDRVTFVCPQPMRHAAPDYEYSKLYAVSSWSYDNCELGEGDAKLVGVCQKPHQRASISIVFRDFTPLPGGLEFLPGHSYYFISTSDGSLAGVDQRKGGLCLDKHMKIKFEVQPDERVVHGSDEADETDEVEVKGPPIESSPRRPGVHQRHGNHENAVADEQSTSLRPLVTLEPSVDDGSSPTPVMYIIHTKSPDEDMYEPYHHRADQQGYQEDVKAEPDGARRTTGAGGWWTIAIAGAMAVAAVRRRINGA